MRTGLAQYGFRFLDGLSPQERRDISLLVNDGVRQEFTALYPECRIECIKTVNPRLPLSPLLNSLRWRKAARTAAGDVLFRIAQVPKYNFWKLNKKLVLTLHDLIVLRLAHKPPFYRAGIYRGLCNADRIITITDCVRQDLFSTFPDIARDKVTVIHNGVSLPAFKQVPLPFEGPFILTVNALVAHKNVITLLKAFNLIKDRIPHRLVLVGKPTPHFHEVLQPYIEANGLQDRVMHIEFAPDDLLYSLYSKTKLFVTTSLQEGFGFTPIEAALCGARVLSTEESALKESTMGLVDYYSPATDEQALAARIMELLSADDPARREQIRSTLLAHYDLHSQARKIYDVLTGE